MRLAIFESAADLGQGNLRLGVVDGEQIHDATGAVPGLTSSRSGQPGPGAGDCGVGRCRSGLARRCSGQ